MNILSQELKDDHLAKITLTKDVLTDAISSLSNLSKGLNADLIFEIGLLEYLRIETDRIKTMAVIEINLIVGGSPVYLEADKELLIARIIQESLNNILKHSKAKTAQILLYYEEQKLKITITDDGVGINSAPTDLASSGIRNMLNRAQILGGQLEILSKGKSGTTITLTIPINRNDGNN